MTLATDLATGLRERGLDVTRPILAVLDRAKSLFRAVKDVLIAATVWLVRRRAA